MPATCHPGRITLSEKLLNWNPILIKDSWFKHLIKDKRSGHLSVFKCHVQMTAHRAFQFCKQYKRPTEFRRLCEIIRNHLANLNKYRDQRDRPDLSAPESLQLYLETRFEQLKIATELELWQVLLIIVFALMFMFSV